jgi:hypothetical protein
MPFIQHDDLSEDLATNTPNEPFDVWVLPWTPRRNPHFVNAHMLHTLPKVRAIDAIPIMQEIARRVVPWKSVHDLLCGPLRRRMLRDTKVHDPSPLVRQNHQDEQNLVGHRRYDKEVKRDQVLVVTQFEFRCSWGLHGLDVSWASGSQNVNANFKLSHY